MGAIIDDGLNFKAYLKFFDEKASIIQGALNRKMPNIGVPNPFRRRIISRIVTSIRLYAYPIWSEALSLRTTRRKLFSSKRD